MNDTLAILSLINDRQKFKKLDLINLFENYRSNENFSNCDDQQKSINFFISFIKENESKNQVTDNEIIQSLEVYKWEISKLTNDNIKILPYFYDDFPKKLLEIKNPPLLLYVKGSLPDLRNSIAIVGTRNLSFFGHKQSREISSYFAENGFTIVSGLARGVDLEAHLGALDVDGKTVAVLPSGINDIYPKEHSKIASDIIKNGALISELSSLEKINKTRFVERNRITSGISNIVIVIESNEDGGTLHQVNIAIEQGKRVFVLQPRDSDIDAMRGFNKVRSLGGEPFESPKDILEALERNHRTSKKIIHQNLSQFV